MKTFAQTILPVHNGPYVTVTIGALINHHKPGYREWFVTVDYAPIEPRWFNDRDSAWAAYLKQTKELTDTISEQVRAGRQIVPL